MSVEIWHRSRSRRNSYVEDAGTILFPRFILNQAGKFFFFCPLWGKKYFRFAGGKAEI